MRRRRWRRRRGVNLQMPVRVMKNAAATILMEACGEKHVLSLYILVSSSPSASDSSSSHSCFLCLRSTPLPRSLSLSLFLSDCLCLSATLSVVGIHHLSWAATSCDPPAKNQTALPTARRAHKETRMLIQTHTHN